MTDAGRGIGIAYAFVNRRERTVSEVRARLVRAEIDPEEIEAVLRELLDYGFLDDGRYALVFTQDKRNLESWGRERIERALRERGVDRDLIEAALADGETSELAGAVSLLEQRFPVGLSDQRERERAFGVLVRKGYDSEVASDAIRTFIRDAA